MNDNKKGLFKSEDFVKDGELTLFGEVILYFLQAECCKKMILALSEFAGGDRHE